MTSDVSVSNRALQILGADTILALTDDTNRARAMLTAYAPVRDAELRRRRWKFSLARGSQPALALAPGGDDFAFQYQLPNDCLRVIQVGNFDLGTDLSDYRRAPTGLYSIEGRQLLTNFAAPLFLRWISQIEDASLFDSSFAEAFSARLAYETCERITQSDSKKQLAEAHYKMAIKEAAHANAVETPPSYLSDDTWVTVRAQ